MPAKMASFWSCHAAGTAAAISVSSGPPKLNALGIPRDGSKSSMKVRASVASSSLSGMNDQALVSIRISECTRSGRRRTTPMTTRPPMEWPSRSTGPPLTVSRNAIRSEVSCSMV